MTALDAVQACLAAEHASAYGYGVLGGVLAGVAAGSSEQQLAAAAYVEHRQRRDDLVALISDQGVDPEPAQAAYELPRRVETLADCRALGRLLEQRAAETYAAAVAETVDRDREFVARALTACALRAIDWGAKPVPFPGIAEF